MTPKGKIQPKAPIPSTHPWTPGAQDTGVIKILNKYNKTKLEILKQLREFIKDDPEYKTLKKHVDNIIAKTKITESAYLKYYSHLLNEAFWSGFKQKLYTNPKLSKFATELSNNWHNATKEIAKIFHTDASNIDLIQQFQKRLNANNLSPYSLGNNALKSIRNFYSDHTIIDLTIKRILNPPAKKAAPSASTTPSSPTPSTQYVPVYTPEQRAQNNKNITDDIKQFITLGNQYIQNITKLLVHDPRLKRTVSKFNIREGEEDWDGPGAELRKPGKSVTNEALEQFIDLQKVFATLIYNTAKRLKYPMETYSSQEISTFLKDLNKGVDNYNRSITTIDPSHAKIIGEYLNRFNKIINGTLFKAIYSLPVKKPKTKRSAASRRKTRASAAAGPTVSIPGGTTRTTSSGG